MASAAASVDSFDQISEFDIKVNKLVAKHFAKMTRSCPTRKMLRPGYITKIGRGRCGKIKRLLKSSAAAEKEEPKITSTKSEVYDFTNKAIRKVFESNNNKSGSENLNSGDGEYSKAFMSFCHETNERKNMPWDGVVTKKSNDRKRKSEKEEESKNGKLKDPLRDIEIGNIRSGNFAEDQFDQNFDVMVDNFIKLEEEELRLNREMRMNKRRKIVEVNLTNDNSPSGSKSSKQGVNKATQNGKINKSIQQGARKLLAKNAPDINSQVGKKPTSTISHPTSNKNTPQLVKKTNPQTVQMVKKTGVQTPSPQIVKKTTTQARNNSTPQIIKSVPQPLNRTPQNVIKSTTQTQSKITPQLTTKKTTATVVEKPSRPSMGKPVNKKANEVTIDLLDDDDDPIISKQVASTSSRKNSLPGVTRNIPEVSNRLNSSSSQEMAKSRISSTQEMAKSRRSLPAEPVKPVSGGLKRIMPGGQMVVPEKPAAGRGRKSLPGDGGLKRILPGGKMVVPEKSVGTAGRGRKSLPDEPTKVTAGGLKRIMPGGEMIVPNQQKSSTNKTAEVITLSTGTSSKPTPGGAKQTGKSGVKLGQSMKPSPAAINPKSKASKPQEKSMLDDLRSRGVNINNGKPSSQAKTPSQSRTAAITQTKTPVNRSQTKTLQTKTPVTGSQTKTPVNRSQTKTPVTGSQTKTPANKTPASMKASAKQPAGRSTKEPELKKVQLSQKQMAALQSLGLM